MMKTRSNKPNRIPTTNSLGIEEKLHFDRIQIHMSAIKWDESSKKKEMEDREKKTNAKNYWREKRRAKNERGIEDEREG